MILEASVVLPCKWVPSAEPAGNASTVAYTGSNAVNSEEERCASARSSISNEVCFGGSVIGAASKVNLLPHDESRSRYNWHAIRFRAKAEVEGMP